MSSSSSLSTRLADAILGQCARVVALINPVIVGSGCAEPLLRALPSCV
ncbi:hypothetical protein [Synechococcus sp. UW105]|nr:hypothetical protein [Synechococcus sp. UW105]